MNDHNFQYLINAYIDNELDVTKSLELEQHMNECSTCSNMYKSYLNIHNDLQNKEFYFQADNTLLKRINSSIGNSVVKQPVYYKRNIFAWQNISLGIAASIIIFLSVIVTRNNSVNNNLNEYILSNHLRSLVLNTDQAGVSHLTDVTSTDEHTVKPWFDGKLDFSPPVIDLNDKGFPLIGGRLDYIKNRQAAVLVYKYKKHIINMFITLAGNNLNANAENETIRGFNLISWQKSGMNFWVISDLSNVQLQLFTDLIKSNI
jgi:anti-sigma factor RsiW